MKAPSYSAHKAFGCRFRQAWTATATYAPLTLRAGAALAVRRTSDGRLHAMREQVAEQLSFALLARRPARQVRTRRTS